MRTTLSLEDDVARGLERLRREREAPFKQIVNDVLRAGLAALASRPGPRAPYETPPVIGKPRLPDLDNIADAIAFAEGEGHP